MESKVSDIKDIIGFKDAYDAFFESFNSLKSEVDVKQKCLKIANRINNKVNDEAPEKIGCIYGLLYAMEQCGVYGLLSKQVEKSLINRYLAHYRCEDESLRRSQRWQLTRFFALLRRAPRFVKRPGLGDGDFKCGDVLKGHTSLGDTAYAVILSVDQTDYESLFAFFLRSHELRTKEDLKYATPDFLCWSQASEKKAGFDYALDCLDRISLVGSFKVTKDNSKLFRDVQAVYYFEYLVGDFLYEPIHNNRYGIYNMQIEKKGKETSLSFTCNEWRTFSKFNYLPLKNYL